MAGFAWIISIRIVGAAIPIPPLVAISIVLIVAPMVIIPGFGAVLGWLVTTTLVSAAGGGCGLLGLLMWTVLVLLIIVMVRGSAVALSSGLIVAVALTALLIPGSAGALGSGLVVRTRTRCGSLRLPAGVSRRVRARARVFVPRMWWGLVILSGAEWGVLVTRTIGRTVTLLGRSVLLPMRCGRVLRGRGRVTTGSGTVWSG